MPSSSLRTLVSHSLPMLYLKHNIPSQTLVAIKVSIEKKGTANSPRGDRLSLFIYLSKKSEYSHFHWVNFRFPMKRGTVHSLFSELSTFPVPCHLLFQEAFNKHSNLFNSLEYFCRMRQWYCECAATWKVCDAWVILKLLEVCTHCASFHSLLNLNTDNKRLLRYNYTRLWNTHAPPPPHPHHQQQHQPPTWGTRPDQLPGALVDSRLSWSPEQCTDKSS